jgi:hypothetical protein
MILFYHLISYLPWDSMKEVSIVYVYIYVYVYVYLFKLGQHEGGIYVYMYIYVFFLR